MRARTGRVFLAGLAISAIAAVSASTVAPGAFAQGGIGGGGSGGGTTLTATTPTATTPTVTSGCASIPKFTSTTGYYATWAAIWTSFTITNNCGVALNWIMNYTNSAGVVEFSRGTSTQYMSTGTIDYDWGKFATTYKVSLTVRSSAGTLMAQTSAGVTTKQPKDLLPTVLAAATAADAAAVASYSVYMTDLDIANTAQAKALADQALAGAASVAKDAAVQSAALADGAATTASSALSAANAASDSANLAAINAAAGGMSTTDPVYISLVITANAAVITAQALVKPAADAALAAGVYGAAAVSAADAAALATTVSQASNAAAMIAVATRDAAYANYSTLEAAALAADATYQAILAASLL